MMEKEIFSAEVQVRKAGERRYGRGQIKINDKYVYLSFKKFLGKTQELKVAREDIAKVGFRDRGAKDITVMMPGHVGDLGWITLDIVLKDGSGFTLYVGQLGKFTRDGWEKYTEKFRKIQKILSIPRV